MTDATTDYSHFHPRDYLRQYYASPELADDDVGATAGSTRGTSASSMKTVTSISAID